jgi:hypothetical protein
MFETLLLFDLGPELNRTQTLYQVSDRRRDAVTVPLVCFVPSRCAEISDFVRCGGMRLYSTVL